MNYFNFDIKKVFLLILFVGLPFYAINTQRKEAPNPWFMVPFSASMAFINHMYSDFSTGVRRTTSFYLNLLDIKKQNLALSKENLELKTRLTQFDEILEENVRLNNLLAFKQESKSDLLIARIVGTDINADYDTIRINKGTADGLKQYMAVISPTGVVGYVFRPQTYTSQVLLLTDRNAAVDGHVQRSRAKGLIEGASRDKLRMLYLLRADDVAVGDLIVTSGMNKIFPKGLPIGKVTTVEKDPNGISQIVELKPEVNPFSLDEVLIVKKAFEEKEEKPEKEGSKP